MVQISFSNYRRQFHIFLLKKKSIGKWDIRNFQLRITCKHYKVNTNCGCFMANITLSNHIFNNTLGRYFNLKCV